MSDTPNGPWREGALWVLDGKCDTCIFRPGNLMRLHAGRRDSMVAECIAKNTVIPCHETLDGERSICRGFYDVHKSDVMILRLAHALNVIRYAAP